MSRTICRHFTDEFKQQIVDLHNTGMKRSEIIKEYNLTPSSFDKWVKQARTTGSFCLFNVLLASSLKTTSSSQSCSLSANDLLHSHTTL